LRTLYALLAFAPTLLAQSIDPAAPGQPEISLERYGLPGTLLAENELLTDLASRTGVAGTQLEGLRLRIALPRAFEIDSIRMQIVDGVFLVRENSFFGAVGGFLLRLARLMLFGQLVDVSDGLQVPSALWFVLLDGDPTKEEPVSVKAAPTISVKTGDKRLSDHGDFVICRMIAATSPFTEIVAMEIKVRDRSTGQQLRYVIPRLVVPPLVSKMEVGELAAQRALSAWLGASP